MLDQAIHMSLWLAGYIAVRIFRNNLVCMIYKFASIKLLNRSIAGSRTLMSEA